MQSGCSGCCRARVLLGWVSCSGALRENGLLPGSVASRTSSPNLPVSFPRVATQTCPALRPAFSCPQQPWLLSPPLCCAWTGILPARTQNPARCCCCFFNSMACWAHPLPYHAPALFAAAACTPRQSQPSGLNLASMPTGRSQTALSSTCSHYHLPQ